MVVKLKKLITISSIAVYGDRLCPYHNLKIGDPIYASIGDFYGLTKINAERLVVESELKYWAIIRQTFITIPNLFTLLDPIMFEQPIHQCLEPITWRDAGFGMSNLVDVPEKFWRKIYNMSGGEKNRFIYHEFMVKMFEFFGLNLYKCMDRKWFALRNFHCGYFDVEDSQRLNEYTHHIRDTLDDYFEVVRQNTPKILKISKIAPSPIVKFFLRFYAKTRKWAKNQEKYGKIYNAYYGKDVDWDSIPNWDIDMPIISEAKEIVLGYTRKEDGTYSIR